MPPFGSPGSSQKTAMTARVGVFPGVANLPLRAHPRCWLTGLVPEDGFDTFVLWAEEPGQLARLPRRSYPPSASRSPTNGPGRSSHVTETRQVAGHRYPSPHRFVIAVEVFDATWKGDNRVAAGDRHHARGGGPGPF